MLRWAAFPQFHLLAGAASAVPACICEPTKYQPATALESLTHFPRVLP